MEKEARPASLEEEGRPTPLEEGKLEDETYQGPQTYQEPQTYQRPIQFNSNKPVDFELIKMGKVSLLMYI